MSVRAVRESVWLVWVLVVMLASVDSALAATLTTTVSQGVGVDWTAAIWKTNGTGTSVGPPVSANAYVEVSNGTVVTPNAANTRVRNPVSTATSTFPGASLTVATNTEFRFKLDGSLATTISFPGVGGNPGLIVDGGFLNIGDFAAVTTIAGVVQVPSWAFITLGDNNAGTGTARNAALAAQLTGNGTVALTQTTPSSVLTVSGSGNTFSGRWIISSGTLVAAGANSLGTNSITVDPAAALALNTLYPGATPLLEFGYDVNSAGTLVLTNGGRVRLHQNCCFGAVVIEGTRLSSGVHFYSDLVAQFPNSFTAGGSGTFTIQPYGTPPQLTPTIATQPVSQTSAVGGVANFSVAADGVGTLGYTWRKNSLNLADSGNVFGSATPSLTLSNLLAQDAGGYSVVVANSAGSVTSQVATLTVFQTNNPNNIMLALVQPLSTPPVDWDTPGYWSDGNPASVSAAANTNATYEVLAGGRLRTPSGAANATFPGQVLTVDGDGIWENNPPSGGNITIGEVRFKQAAPLGTVAFNKLVMNGGQLDAANDGVVAVTGEVDALANTPIYNDTPLDHGLRLDAWLTGNGSIEYHGYNQSGFMPGYTNNLNVAGTSNTFSGAWNVVLGVLLGTGTNALGTNTITVGPAGALETTYNLNNPNGTLILYGRMFLHQNDTFKSVAVNGVFLAPGTYTFAQLAVAYPNNFPPSWTQQNGSASSTGSGSISVLGAAAPPVLPVGLDAFRQWDHWAYQRIGERAYMRSTYDRTGGNEGADASHFLYQLSDSNNVTLDVAGPGVLYFSRYNHWHGSPWDYVVDGTDNVVQETSTANPSSPVAGSVFLPTNAFPSPLAVTWSTTQGADLNWVPIAFTNSFRMAYGRTHYGTGYYIYHQYVGGANLSQPLQSWSLQNAPEQDVLNLIASAGTDISPTNNVTVLTGSVPALGAGQTNVLFALNNTSATIRKLTFTVPLDQAVAFGRARLRLTWDGRNAASVDAPVALFFGAGTLYNRSGKQYLVKALPCYIQYGAQNVELACFWPMPFFKSARLELIGPATNAVSGITWSAGYQPLTDAPANLAYLHATYCDQGTPQPGQDLVLLDTRSTEGGGDWSGSFVGTSFIFSDDATLSTLEGDPRFFFDDSQTPQAQGTGTEEWGGGGDYWGGQNMTLAFAGHPTGAPSAAAAQNGEDMIESAYRFLLSDLMPFGKNAVIRLEHGGADDSTEHYQTVAFWYGAPAAALVRTDQLKVGDTNSEAAHNYVSPQATAPYSLTSRYEWGVDSFTSSVASAPLASPTDYAEFQFQANAGTRYYLWVRGKNVDGSVSSDASWFQFDQDIGTTSAGSYNGAYGLGNWGDQASLTYFWSSGRPNPPDPDAPLTVTFSSSGTHTLRVQPRQWRHYLEQIWLSATQSTTPAAGAAPVPGPNDIVLRSTDAVNLHGLVRLVSDAGSTVGSVLEINTATGSSSGVAYPAFTDTGRTTTGASEFTLQLTPQNYGVLLRRKLDYSYPNQRALVYVADASAGEPGPGDWALAGTWYLAGANTCVYSNPGDELGATVHTVETSNRRFRDDEFLVPLKLTQGRSAIRLRVTFTPANLLLYPGRALDPQAWSEMRYDAYCYVLPDWRSRPGVYQEQAGRVVIEAQHFQSRVNNLATGYHFHLVPDDNGLDAPWYDAPSAPAGGFLNSRTGKYLQITPGSGLVNGTDASVTNAPWVDYKVYVQTPGTYRLYLRWRGADTNSASLYAGIVELKDGKGGSIADWYSFSGDPSADFANSWRTAQAAEVSDGSTVPGTSADWAIGTPGVYTIRLSCRQSGAAVDALCLQLANLPAPSENSLGESASATDLPPFVILSQTPGPGQTGVSSNTPVVVQVMDTLQPTDPSAFALFLDGAQVSAFVGKAGNLTTVSFTPPTPFAAGSAHMAELRYTDANPLLGNSTNAWGFLVADSTAPLQFTGAQLVGGRISIQWLGGGTLQSTTNLVPPILWSNTATGGTFSEPAVGRKFYRLAR